MRLPVNDWSKWYIAQGFGEKTDYGYHEGVDLNLKTGGDSDLGQPLLAIASGQVTSVHEHTGVPTFGKHIHIKFNSPFGEYWVHYAHCQKILVPEGSQVTEGQQIAELGKSGTTVAHCHFTIKNQPTGIDGIAKTLDDLKKWEDPIVFIEKCMEKEKEVLNEQILKDQVSDLQDKVKSLNESLAKAQLENSELRTSLENQERDNDDLSKQLLEARSQRDSAVGEKKILEKKVEDLVSEAETLKKGMKALEEEKQGLRSAVKTASEAKLDGFSNRNLIGELLRRIIRKE